MSLIASIEVDDAEFIATFNREWDLFGKITIDLAGQQTEDLFVEWMLTWHRKYKIRQKITKKPFGWEVDVNISNKGSEATGTSPYDKRPPRDGVPGFVNYGTSQRFAIMTAGFSAKTAVGIIASSPGAGGLQTFADEPVDGLDARLVDDSIALQIEAIAEQIVDDGLAIVFG